MVAVTDQDIIEQFQFMRKNIKRILLYAAISAIIAVVIGLIFDLHELGYNLVLTAFSVAFLPFILILAVVGFCIGLTMLSFIAAMLGGDGGAAFIDPSAFSPILEWFMKVYYKILFNIRHAGFWGGLLGILVGGGMLTGIYTYIIFPKETATTETMLEVQELIKAYYDEEGGFPDNNEAKQLTWEAIGADDKSGVIKDAFGNPYIYEKEGMWKYAEYSLRSLGRDGKISNDDFLLNDMTTLKWIKESIDFEKSDSKLGFKVKLQSVQKLRVSEGE